MIEDVSYNKLVCHDYNTVIVFVSGHIIIPDIGMTMRKVKQVYRQQISPAVIKTMTMWDTSHTNIQAKLSGLKDAQTCVDVCYICEELVLVKDCNTEYVFKCAVCMLPSHAWRVLYNLLISLESFVVVASLRCVAKLQTDMAESVTSFEKADDILPEHFTQCGGLALCGLCKAWAL